MGLSIDGSWEGALPRYFRAGPILLDLFHRDGTVDECWLGLHPREFEVLWRLAQTPHCTVSEDRLLNDVWRLDHHPETNRVAVSIFRIRAKLDRFGLAGLVSTVPERGYRLDVDAGPVTIASEHSLDSNRCLRDDGD